LIAIKIAKTFLTATGINVTDTLYFQRKTGLVVAPVIKDLDGLENLEAFFSSDEGMYMYISFSWSH